MTPVERRVLEDRRATVRADLGFEEERCPCCRMVQEHANLCAACRERGER